jgi:hypothetical protein
MTTSFVLTREAYPQFKPYQPNVFNACDWNAGVPAGWIGCVLAAEWEACAGWVTKRDSRGLPGWQRDAASPDEMRRPTSRAVAQLCAARVNVLEAQKGDWP